MVGLKLKEKKDCKSGSKYIFMRDGATRDWNNAVEQNKYYSIDRISALITTGDFLTFRSRFSQFSKSLSQGEMIHFPSPS